MMAISFDLANSGHVRLQVFDLSGRLLRDIRAGEFADGEHTVVMDGSELDPGLYFMVLKTTSGTLIERCMKL